MRYTCKKNMVLSQIGIFRNSGDIYPERRTEYDRFITGNRRKSTENIIK